MRWNKQLKWKYFDNEINSVFPTLYLVRKEGAKNKIAELHLPVLNVPSYFLFNDI